MLTWVLHSALSCLSMKHTWGGLGWGGKGRGGANLTLTPPAPFYPLGEVTTLSSTQSLTETFKSQTRFSKRIKDKLNLFLMPWRKEGGRERKERRIRMQKKSEKNNMEKWPAPGEGHTLSTMKKAAVSFMAVFWSWCVVVEHLTTLRLDADETPHSWVMEIQQQCNLNQNVQTWPYKPQRGS